MVHQEGGVRECVYGPDGGPREGRVFRQVSNDRPVNTTIKHAVILMPKAAALARLLLHGDSSALRAGFHSVTLVDKVEPGSPAVVHLRNNCWVASSKPGTGGGA